LEGLIRTVNSLQKQCYKNVEIWIIDGESKDGSINFLRELDEHFNFISEKDNGLYDAMNKGISLSKGKWLYFLGSGDILLNENVLEEVFKNPIKEDEFIIAGKVLYSGNTKPFIYSKNKLEKKPSWSFAIWLRNGLHHQGTFYRKDVFLENKYNLKYKTLSDYWFNLFLFNKKMKCKILDITISECNSDGVSKLGGWKLYKEEVNLKTNQSSILFSPIFYTISIIKYLLRKIIND
jgi:glycosyltransferase involved in cell wall biosynthesis